MFHSGIRDGLLDTEQFVVVKKSSIAAVKEEKGHRHTVLWHEHQSKPERRELIISCFMVKG